MLRVLHFRGKFNMVVLVMVWMRFRFSTIIPVMKIFSGGHRGPVTILRSRALLIQVMSLTLHKRERYKQ